MPADYFIDTNVFVYDLETVLQPLVYVPSTMAMYQDVLDTHARYQLQFYDALIVAGALWAGCKTLYSEGLQHGQRFNDLVITNPFLS